jgi:hypothetical protein
MLKDSWSSASWQRNKETNEITNTSESRGGETRAREPRTEAFRHSSISFNLDITACKVNWIVE